jgi:hypothetical protein
MFDTLVPSFSPTSQARVGAVLVCVYTLAFKSQDVVLICSHLVRLSEISLDTGCGTKRRLKVYGTNEEPLRGLKSRNIVLIYFTSSTVTKVKLKVNYFHSHPRGQSYCP